MKTTQLNHVALHVSDVEASVNFYQKVLLLKPLPRPAFTFPGAWFQLGVDQELHLIGEREEEVQSASRGNHFALMVDDIDAWQGHLEQSEAAFHPRRTRPDCAYQIFLADPDGHYIELCTPPGEAPN